MTAATALRLDTIGRTTYRGIAWVVYSDGAYRHAVRASHYDRACDAPIDDEDRAAAYDRWSGRSAAFADDATAAKIARKLHVDVIHSALGGTCAPIAVR